MQTLITQVLHGLLCLLFFQIQCRTNCSGLAITLVVWVLSHESLTRKKCSHILVYRPIWRYFLSWASLFPNDRNLCKLEKNRRRTIWLFGSLFNQLKQIFSNKMAIHYYKTFPINFITSWVLNMLTHLETFRTWESLTQKENDLLIFVGQFILCPLLFGKNTINCPWILTMSCM